MDKKFLTALVVVFVVWMAGSFVVHGLLLSDGYAQLPNLFRTEEEPANYSYMMLLTHVVILGIITAALSKPGAARA